MKTLTEIEKWLEKECNVLLFGDEKDVLVAKLYDSHGKRAAALGHIALEYSKNNNSSVVFNEALRCYSNAIGKAPKFHAKRRIEEAIFKAKEWLAWDSKLRIGSPITVRLGKITADEWLSLGNFLMYFGMSYLDVERLDNCERLAAWGASSCFQEIQIATGAKTERTSLYNGRG